MKRVYFSLAGLALVIAFAVASLRANAAEPPVAPTNASSPCRAWDVAYLFNPRLSERLDLLRTSQFVTILDGVPAGWEPFSSDVNRIGYRRCRS